MSDRQHNLTTRSGNLVDATLPYFSHDRAYTGRYRQHFHDLTSDHVSGRVLDIGAGGGSTNDHWEFPGVTDVVRMDVGDYPELDVRADGTRLPFQDDAFDTVLCSAVFEHVKLSRLPTLFEEIKRVLAPGGTLVGAVAFQYPLHGEPHDYSRPSIYGLRNLATAAGLETTELYRGGSFIDTLLHVLFSPVRRTSMYAGVPWISSAFALVHYPLLAVAWLAATIVTALHGSNPWGARWPLLSGIVAEA